VDCERERARPMVASYSPASPIPWRPTARTLGALFAGSAVTLSGTVSHGSSLLTGDDEMGSITEPAASPNVAEPAQPQAASFSASFSAPGQAAPWTPGASPQWSSALKDLPVRRAPVRAAARHPGETAVSGSAKPAGSGRLAAVPPTPRHSAEGTSYSPGKPGETAPQVADPQRSGLIGGVVGNVFHVTNGLGQ
jgi:hypothetical protein